MPSSLANSFLISTSDDREAFRRCDSEHISLLSGRLSAILAEAHTHMSQVETYYVCVPTSSTSSTVIHARSTCTGDSRLLAHSAYRCSVRRTVSTLSASEDNIVVALMQSASLSVIERPFSELEQLVLLPRDSVPMTLPSAFRTPPYSTFD